ncbi:MAG: hypothetical protein ABSF77_07180 [Spirochaetia bacterium]|jgi:hypothetical protein
MSTAASTGGRARRKPIIRRIVILAIAAFVIIEPLVMYKSLQHQREQRRTVMEQPVAAAAQ